MAKQPRNPAPAPAAPAPAPAPARRGGRGRRRHHLLRIVVSAGGRALFGMLVVGIIAGTKLLFEQTDAGLSFDRRLYGWLSLFTLSSSTIEMRPDDKVAVVDIHELKPTDVRRSGDIPAAEPGAAGAATVDGEGEKFEAVTPRHALAALLEAIAAAGPRAIGLDVELGPLVSAKGRLHPDDRDFFVKCKAINEKRSLPIFVAVGERSEFGTSAEWLGDEQFSHLAATCFVPTNRACLPLRLEQAGGRPLWGMAAGLVAACGETVPGMEAEPEESPQEEAKAQAETGHGEDPAKGAHAEPGQPTEAHADAPSPPHAEAHAQAGHHPAGWLEDEAVFSVKGPDAKPRWIRSFWLDYAYLRRPLVIQAHTPAAISAAASQLSGKIVLVGDVLRATDTVNLPGISSDPVPGVLLHACGVDTLLKGAVAVPTHEARLLLDIGIAGAIILIIFTLRVLIFAGMREDKLNEHAAHALFTVAAMVLTLAIAWGMACHYRILWTDATVVVAALAIHGMVEHRLRSWLQRAWKALVSHEGDH